MQEEKKFQTKILNDLRSLGKYCAVFKLMKASDNAYPDIYFSTALTGSVWIETKKPKGIEAKLQTIIIAKLNKCGTKAYACYDWEQWYSIKRELGLSNRDAIIKAHNDNEMLLS